MDKEKIIAYYKQHQTAINGALMGLVFSIVVLIIGVIKTIFIAICVGTGYYIGKRISEDKAYITNLLDRILPPGTYR